MKRNIAMAALVSCAATFAHTGTMNNADAVRALRIDTGKVGDRMHLQMVLDFDSLNIESNRRIIFTPLLIGENAADTVTFSEVMVNGRRQHISYELSLIHI